VIPGKFIIADANPLVATPPLRYFYADQEYPLAELRSNGGPPVARRREAEKQQGSSLGAPGRKTIGRIIRGSGIRDKVTPAAPKVVYRPASFLGIALSFVGRVKGYSFHLFFLSVHPRFRSADALGDRLGSDGSVKPRASALIYFNNTVNLLAPNSERGTSPGAPFD